MPLDTMTDYDFWTTEDNVKTFAWGFYPTYFEGYGSGFTWGAYFSGQSLNDDFAPPAPSQFTKNVPTSGGGWSFSSVRKANLFLYRVKKVPMSAEAMNHWTGIARFFRAMEYSDLVMSFGDVPWYRKVLKETETAELYRPRDSRSVVMDSVLVDFQYAAANVRAVDGTKGLTVNKYVVLSYMSRKLLSEGSWQKYHNNNLVKAAEYFEAAKWAANEVMTNGGFTLSSSYRGIFSSLDLSTNTETILYRKYETALLTHSLNSYVNKEPQTGASKNAIDSYLSKDGIPILVSPLYKGDKTINDVMTDRDPRLTETFVKELRINGHTISYSTSDYPCQKFLNETIKDLINGSGSLNDTDAPVIRLGEVLMNYAEAGYIIPAWKPESQRAFVDPKVYLSPLPLDQINLYKAQGIVLTQNPGW